MIGCDIRHFEHCESTNDEAARWAAKSEGRAPHGGVVVADSQSAGRGRLGRVWHSPPKENLYFSTVLRLHLPPERIPPLTLCAGVAICETVRRYGVSASIKWPNDVFVDGKKLAGVLTEMSTSGNGAGTENTRPIVVGIGVNVNAVEFPEELQATSIRLQTESEHCRSLLLKRLLAAMDFWVRRYCAEGVSALAAAFASQSLLTGRNVQAYVAGSLVTGRVISLAEDGALLLADDMGQRHRVIAGDVELVHSSQS